MDKLWSALSDSTRRDILTMLHERDMNAGEIAEHFSLRRPTVSHHLSILKSAHLVYSHKESQSIIYSLNKSTLRDAGKFIASLTR